MGLPVAFDSDHSSGAALQPHSPCRPITSGTAYEDDRADRGCTPHPAMFGPRQYHWLGHRRAESATAPRSDEIDDQIECKRVVKWSAISHGIPIGIPTKNKTRL